ncbi:MAG TPA: DCC1-like thiol-disulfide oxidoreductase family protein [Vicinamibacteria bacterium]|nr:DCC1-like thiol-disulfide oxidoreductase family protein [Vicinamibacteria bacterium]
MQADTLTPGPVAFVDGTCNLCNASVRFMLDHERRPRLRFAPLQGATFRALSERHPELHGVDSFVLAHPDGRVHVRSSAVLRALSLLGGPWRLCAALLAIPRPLRDAVYDVVARHRYRWFGRRQECRLPTPAVAARLLD